MQVGEQTQPGAFGLQLRALQLKLGHPLLCGQPAPVEDGHAQRAPSRETGVETAQHHAHLVLLLIGDPVPARKVQPGPAQGPGHACVLCRDLHFALRDQQVRVGPKGRAFQVLNTSPSVKRTVRDTFQRASGSCPRATASSLRALLQACREPMRGTVGLQVHQGVQRVQPAAAAHRGAVLRPLVPLQRGAQQVLGDGEVLLQAGHGVARGGGLQHTASRTPRSAMPATPAAAMLRW